MDLSDCLVNSRAWRDGKLVDVQVSTDEIRTGLQEHELIWLDLLNPTEVVLLDLARILGLSATAVEDMLAPFERPKVTRHGDSLFFTVYGTKLDATGGLQTQRISAIQYQSALITVRLDDHFDVDGLIQRWEENPSLLSAGVGALIHGLLDLVVDSHFSTIQLLDDRLEAMEDQLFLEQQTHGVFAREAYDFRKSLVALRRVVLPMREVVNALVRHRDEMPELSHWYDDLYDHVLRASEWTDSLRDLVTTMFETNLSLQDSRLNLVMKKLAAWAAIIAVPTAITGWFGQNLPYPGFAHESGLWLSVFLILGGSVFLYVLFRKLDWL